MSIFDIDAQVRRFVIDHIETIHAPNVKVTDVRNIQYPNLMTNSEITYLYDSVVPNEVWDTLDFIEERNGTSLIQEFQISRTEETTSSFTWSIESGFTFSVSVGASVKVPFVGGIDTSIETSLSLSTTSSQTEERTRSWEFTKTVKVPPQTIVTARVMLLKTKPRVPFNLNAFFQGNFTAQAYINYQGRPSGFYDVNESLAKAFEGYAIPNFSIQNGVLNFKTSGVFQANDGIKGLIDLNESPLGTPVESDEYYSKHWVFPGVLKNGLEKIQVIPEGFHYVPIE